MARKQSGPPTRVRGVTAVRVVYDEQTLLKVYMGLAAAGVRGQLAIDAVSGMQNQGVLFREAEANE